MYRLQVTVLTYGQLSKAGADRPGQRDGTGLHVRRRPHVREHYLRRVRLPYLYAIRNY